MSWTGYLLDILFVLALLGVIGWWSWMMAERPPQPPPLAPRPYCPAGPDHSLTLNPITRDKLSCMFCPHDEPLPRGAPESLVERIQWARLHGLLWSQGGRSVSFLEALRGTE